MKVVVIQHGTDGPWGLVAEADADLVVLPENSISPKPISYSDYAREASKLASRLGSYVLAGAQYVRLGDGIASIGLVAAPSGGVSAACEKLFPSASVGERGRLTPGVLRGPVGVGRVRAACIACVDIYYPEVARYHALRGAVLLVNPASIPANRVYSWNALLSARASENSVFVVGANKVGTPYPDGRLTGGYSAVYTPEGELLASLGPYPGVLRVTLDLRLVEVVRGRRRFLDDTASLDASGFYNWRLLEGRRH